MNIKNFITLISINCIFLSCVYFNTFYNSESSFEEALKIIEESSITVDNRLPSQARKLLGESIENSKLVIKDYPDSKYIDDVLKEFIGEFSHLPPMFSAKKINGTRLYKLARQNKTVDRKIITTNISNVKFRSFERDRISFEVSCSKGTYIRVLGNEIAKKLGTVGYLDQLTRIAVGDHKISESISINEFENQWKSINS